MQDQDSSPAARRGFLKLIAGGFLAVPFAAPLVAVFRSLVPGADPLRKPRPALALNKIPRDEPIAYRLRYEAIRGPYRQDIERLLFLRRTDDGVLALSAECTHAGCNVAWDAESKVFACPCHDGGFHPDGSPAYGPPVTPLAKYRAVTAGEDDVVSIEV